MPEKNNFETFYALSLACQLGFLIVVPIVGFLALGFWGDRFFGVQPFFLILGLLVGIITTVYETYHLIVPLIRNEGKENDEH
jgi:F0F1-type ATP synthase assembly protein I